MSFRKIYKCKTLFWNVKYKPHFILYENVNRKSSTDSIYKSEITNCPIA